MGKLVGIMPGLVLCLSTCLYPAYGSKEGPDGKQPVIHVIPHAHFDIDFPDVASAQIDRQQRKHTDVHV